MNNPRPKIVATIEARMTSTRLPGKVLLKTAGKPLLAHLVERVRKSRFIDEIVVATTTNDTDDPIAGLAAQLGIKSWRGSEEDVLGRVLEAARASDAAVIVELTGDNPLIDPELIDEAIRFYFENPADYVSNFLGPELPDGFPVQVFSTDVLADADSRTENEDDREHVTLYIRRNSDRYSIKAVPVAADLNRPDVSLTLDEPADYEVISAVFEALYPKDPNFTIRDCLAYLDKNPNVKSKNRDAKRKSVRGHWSAYSA